MNASYLVRSKRPVKIAYHVSDCWLIVSCVFLLMVPMSLMCTIPQLPPMQIFTTKQISYGRFCDISVLGLARTGLIFTGLQEGAQPGGLTPPGQTEPGIPYRVPSCWVPVGGSWAAGTHLQLGSVSAGPVRESGPVGRAVCVVLFSSSVSLLFLFPLFAVLLNCPYPDPPVSASFFPFSSAPRRGEGRPRGALVAGGSQTRTITNFKRVEGNVVVYDQSPEIIPIQYVVKDEQKTVRLFWIVEGQASVLCKYTGIHKGDPMLSVSHDRSFKAEFTTY